MDVIGKKHTKDKEMGQVVITVYEDSFDVAASQSIDVSELYLIVVGIKDYLDELAESLDKPANMMLQ